MKHPKKQNIKKIYKKSILPAIVLFLFFIIICVYVIFALIFYFQQYIVVQKSASLQKEGEQLVNIIMADAGDEDLLEHFSSFEKYLQEENDLCITDKNNTVLKTSKNTEPDFETSWDNELILYTDTNAKVEWKSFKDYLSVREIWNRIMLVLKTRDINDRNWLSQEIPIGTFWIEIPVESDKYNLYYKATLTQTMYDNSYIVIQCAEIMIALLFPVILLMINVLSSLRMQRRMIKLLYMDPVTGCKNWLYFVQQGKKILARRKKSGNFYVAVNLHMSHYQEYCLCYGNDAGEELLVAICELLHTKMGKREVFARFSKADFGLLLQTDSIEKCELRLEKLFADLAEIHSDGTLSFQAGMYQMDGLPSKQEPDLERFYHYANAARCTVHEKEGQITKWFDAQILQELLWKKKVEDTMETALRNHEFQMYLQPKYNPKTNKLVGAEALVRWVSPTEGIVPPGRFIPIFEENGFITQLDDYMIASVAKFQAERKKQGKKDIIISVNVSRANFTKVNLSSHICQLIDEYGAEHSGIELEVTESAFFGDKDVLQKILRELKDCGFRLSMDDFGAGYSSLNSLKELPVDVLKLDMEFFRGRDAEKRGEIVVKEAIHLAKSLKMEIVAEGIEKKEQVEFLVANECDMIQGYYFAKPMPVEEFNERAERDA